MRQEELIVAARRCALRKWITPGRAMSAKRHRATMADSCGGRKTGGGIEGATGGFTVKGRGAAWPGAVPRGLGIVGKGGNEGSKCFGGVRVAKDEAIHAVAEKRADA